MTDFIELPMNIEDITDPKAGPEGDYNLIIREVQRKDNESGQLKNLLVLCDVVSGPAGVDCDDLATVMHNISIPQAEDDQEKLKNKLRFMKRFGAVFSIPSLLKGTGINLAEFAGKSARCHLTQEEYQGQISNKIKLPNLK